MKQSKTYTYVLSICFLSAVLIVPVLFFTFHKAKIDLVENRMLKTEPVFNLKKLDPFPKAYEEFFNDHFPYRRAIINQNSYLNYMCFDHITTTNEVIIGKDNWFFKIEKHLDFYTGKHQLTEQELDKISQEIEKRRSYLANKGIQMYFVLVPLKHSLYPEYLPSEKLTFYNNYTMADHLRKRLNNMPDLNFVDLKDSLFRYKKEGPLFQKTDNHWNELGSYYGAKIVHGAIQKHFPILQLPDRSQYEAKIVNKTGGNIANMMCLAEELGEQYIQMNKNFESLAKSGPKRDYPIIPGFGIPESYEIIRTNSEASPLKAVFIRDSFAKNQIKFWEDCFSESIFIWDAWQYGFNKDIIDQEQPDIVVYQMLESQLPDLLKTIEREEGLKNNFSSK